ncbi:hypothetical protein Bca52824_015953 [Brassica carinata]|uniref:Uncharacterized protein n=1 Tax=Brassica carinata TaxID=52824 RepID=A0A8X7W5J7_BRACI|nr:hypothetical protein Bca52824_015953 [Brassica carinata]
MSFEGAIVMFYSICPSDAFELVEIMTLQDVTEEQARKASPTNSEDYKTPPEDDLMTESRTPDIGMTKRSRYMTRSSKKTGLEGKCIPISSTKKDDFQTKRIPRRSIKIGGVYTIQEIEDPFPKLQETQIYALSRVGESAV